MLAGIFIIWRWPIERMPMNQKAPADPMRIKPLCLLQEKDGNFKGVFSQVLQDMLHRLNKSFKTFFRRIKAGEIDVVVVLETKGDQISEECK